MAHQSTPRVLGSIMNAEQMHADLAALRQRVESAARAIVADALAATPEHGQLCQEEHARVGQEEHTGEGGVEEASHDVRDTADAEAHDADRAVVTPTEGVSASASEVEKCPICYGDLDQNDLLVLPCGHCMHDECRLLAESSRQQPPVAFASEVLPGPPCPMCNAVTPLYFDGLGHRISGEIVNEHAMLLLDESVARGADHEENGHVDDHSRPTLVAHIQSMLQSMGMHLGMGMVPDSSLHGSTPMFPEDDNTFLRHSVDMDSMYADPGDATSTPGASSAVTFVSSAPSVVSIIRSSAYTSQLSQPPESFSDAVQQARLQLRRAFYRRERRTDNTGHMQHRVENLQHAQQNPPAIDVIYTSPADMVDILTNDEFGEINVDRYVILVPVLSEQERRWLGYNGPQIAEEIQRHRGTARDTFSIHVVVTRGYHFNSRQHIERLLGGRAFRTSCTSRYHRGHLLHRAHVVPMTAEMWQPSTLGEQMFAMTGGTECAKVQSQEARQQISNGNDDYNRGTADDDDDVDDDADDDAADYDGDGVDDGAAADDGDGVDDGAAADDGDGVDDGAADDDHGGGNDDDAARSDDDGNENGGRENGGQDNGGHDNARRNDRGAGVDVRSSLVSRTQESSAFASRHVQSSSAPSASDSTPRYVTRTRTRAKAWE